MLNSPREGEKEPDLIMRGAMSVQTLEARYDMTTALTM